MSAPDLAPLVVRPIAPLVVTPLVVRLIAPLVRFAFISATKVPALLEISAASGMNNPVQAVRLVAPLVAPLAVHLVAPPIAHLAALTMVTALVAALGLGEEGDPGPQNQNHLPQPAEVQALPRLHSF